MERSKLPLLGIAGVAAAAAAAAAYSLSRYTFSPLCCISSSESPHSQLDHQRFLDQSAKLQLLNQLEDYRGIEAFGALRIPDANGKEQKEFDVVILTRRKLCIVEVKSWGGTINCDLDGIWCQLLEDGSLVKYGNIVTEVRKRATLLEEYLLRRGLKLPPSFIKIMIVMGNADNRLDETILQQPEVLSLQQFHGFLEKQSEVRVNGCVKLKLSKKKRVMSKDLYHQLYGLLKTAPSWDRLTLKKGDAILGDFLQFDASAQNMEALKSIKRSRISEIRIQNKDLKEDTSTIEIKCIVRDYRNVLRRSFGGAENTWCTIVSGDVDVVFQCLGSSVCKTFKLDTVMLLELAA